MLMLRLSAKRARARRAVTRPSASCHRHEHAYVKRQKGVCKRAHRANRTRSNSRECTSIVASKRRPRKLRQDSSDRCRTPKIPGVGSVSSASSSASTARFKSMLRDPFCTTVSHHILGSGIRGRNTGSGECLERDCLPRYHAPLHLNRDVVVSLFTSADLATGRCPHHRHANRKDTSTGAGWRG